MSLELQVVVMLLIGVPIVLYVKQRLGHFDQKKS